MTDPKTPDVPSAHPYTPSSAFSEIYKAIEALRVATAALNTRITVMESKPMDREMKELKELMREHAGRSETALNTIVDSQKSMEEKYDAQFSSLKEEVGELKVKQRYAMLLWGLLGSIGGIVGKGLWDSIPFTPS